MPGFLRRALVEARLLLRVAEIVEVERDEPKGSHAGDRPTAYAPERLGVVDTIVEHTRLYPRGAHSDAVHLPTAHHDAHPTPVELAPDVRPSRTSTSRAEP